MGLLDSILGGVLGGGQSSPIAGLLGGLLGGGQSPVAPGMAPGAAMGGGLGGLSGLLGRFQQAGLGNVAQSWVGNGANQPVSPQQLQQVFGQDQVQQMSQQTGLPPQDLLSQLAQYLPNIVDRATPEGRLPDGQDPFAGTTTTAFDGPGIPAGTTFRT